MTEVPLASGRSPDRIDADLLVLSRADWVRPGEQRTRLPTGGVYWARRRFTLPEGARTARVWVTALGVYELHVNGVVVGDELMRPGWTDVARRLQYQVHDVSDLLRAGANVIGVVVAPGWYAGRISTERTAPVAPDRPELLLALDGESPDGTPVSLVSDESWEWRGADVLTSDLYDGEVVDLRLASPTWASPEATDLGRWERVERSPGTAGALVPQHGPPVRVTDRYPPGAVSWLDDGSAVVDLVRNEVGYLRLTVRCPAGNRVEVSYGELLDVDGQVYTENLRSAGCTDTFYASADDVDVLLPRFTFRGARYAQVRGLDGPGSLLAAERLVIGTDLTRVGWFDSSSELLNEVYRCVLTSQRANFLEVPTDCPQRDERLGWMADALLFAPVAAYGYDIEAFMGKWLADVLDARSSQGGFGDVAPRPTGRLTFRNVEGAPAWADAGVLLPWLMYERYGRLEVLETMFPAMEEWLRLVHAANPDGVWRNGRGRDYGDWVPAGPDTSHDLFATAWLCRSTSVAAQVAGLLGRTGAAAWLEERAAASRVAFNDSFVDREAGRVRALDPVGSPAAARRFAPAVAAETQTGYVLALAFDLVEEKLALRLGERLAELVEVAGGRLQTGFIGSAHLLDALEKGARSDLAVDLMLRTEYPSLGYMVRNGATSVWERWDGIQPDAGGPASATMNSFNHYCLGSMFSWVIGSLCGLRPGRDVGFGSFGFAPVATERLDWAAFRFQSPLGLLSVRWERGRDGEIRGEVGVPPGSRCRISAEISTGRDLLRVDTSTLPGGSAVVGEGTHRFTWRR